MSFCFGVCKVRSLSIHPSIHHSSHCALQLIGYIKLIYAKLFVIESNQTVIVAPSSPAPHILQHFRDLCCSTAQHDAWVSVRVYSWVSVCLFMCQQLDQMSEELSQLPYTICSMLSRLATRLIFFIMLINYAYAPWDRQKNKQQLLLAWQSAYHVNSVDHVCLILFSRHVA